jgi:hypothetical protein
MPVCDDVSARMISLPLFDLMTHQEVDQVAECLHASMGVTEAGRRGRKRSRSEQFVPLVYGNVSRANGEIPVD